MKPPYHLPLSIYGWTYWLPALLAGALLTLVLLLLPHVWPLAFVSAIITLGILAFFRDFPRVIPSDDGLLVAPADGTVTDVTQLDTLDSLGCPTLKIGIFLSVLSVHVNRSPCAGEVLEMRYVEGEFLDARHPECGIRNQSNTIILARTGTTQPIAVVKQIVGAIARRIICPLELGDRLARGERFGMIAFGSRTELYVPASEWVAAVKVGQKVAGGKDVVARRK
jgi:phosphatidylserine decarboxylase